MADQKMMNIHEKDSDTWVLVNALKSARIIEEGLVSIWRFEGPSAPLMGPF